ncbi:MAG: hypothetical protein KA354_18100 [Phycisphaerae bacterium]|nr:hypothetical protein [Phycisphaerae bacterium]
MLRTMQILMLFLVFGSIAAAEDRVELSYRAEPSFQLTVSVEGTAEGHVLGLPNTGKLVLVSREKRKLLAQMSEVPAGETASLKMTGESSSESTVNGNTRDPMTEAVGPVVFTFDRRGQVVRTEVDPFEASPQNLMRFRWWRYIVQQLDLPPVLPEEPVAPGATWTAAANLTGPDGKPLKAKQEFRFLGTSDESEVRTAWLRGEIMVPLELSFKSDEGVYQVEGKVRIDKLYAFDIDKGLPLGSTDRAVIDMSITAKRAEGEEFRSQLYMRADGKTTMKPKTDELGTADVKKPESEQTKDK